MQEEAIYSNINFERAFEIQFPSEIGFPPLHMLLGKEANSPLITGLCLDLGNYAHSENEDIEKAYGEVIFSLVESCVSYIFTLYDRGLIDNLYYNKIHDPSLWNHFSNLNDNRKIASLKKSFETRGKEKDETAQLSWNIEDDFPSLEKLGKKQLSHWLEMLSQASPEEAKLILHKMIASVFDPAHFKKQNLQKIA